MAAIMDSFKCLEQKKLSDEQKLAALTALIEAVNAPGGVELSAYVLSLLPNVVAANTSKNKDVKDAAKKACEAIVKVVPEYGLNPVIDLAIASLDAGCKWQLKNTACLLLQRVADKAPTLVDRRMAELVPLVSATMWDTKESTKKKAKIAMKAICAAIDNRDLEPFIPALIKCITKPEEVEDCVYALAATTFVQTVSCAALSITVPLLARGFKERKTATKRKCAVITENMAKLVESAEDVAPFMPELEPALRRAKDEVADVECRTRCETAWETLKRLATKKVEVPRVVVDRAKVAAAVAETSGLKVDDITVVMAADVAATMVELAEAEDQDDWTTHFVSLFGKTLADKADAVVAAAQKACGGISGSTGPSNYVDPSAEDADVEELCDCKFSLAYGSRILLNNARLHLRRGFRYGIVASKSAGKTTLLKAIANGQLDGFPPASELKTVFVDTDVQGFKKAVQVAEYVHATVGDEGVSLEDCVAMLTSVGFTDEMLKLPITALSGGWRMKLALARAMLRKADVLLMDEPTNHLDVLNVQWVQDYLTGEACKKVTSVMVSHDTKFLDNVATHIIYFSDLKLSNYKGNLSHFTELFPDTKSYYDLTATKLKFAFPPPGPLEGVRSKGKPILQMSNVWFRYPGVEKYQIEDITVRVSLASRIACVGANGAGKSTMIKVLTGEMEPTKGNVVKHPNCRFAYVAQHAFHHIEQHLDKTPNEYIRWRYQGGEDKEALVKATTKLSPEEEKAVKTPIEVSWEDEDGKTHKEKRVVERLVSRRKQGKTLEYEIKWVNKMADKNTWFDRQNLLDRGFEKLLNELDRRISAHEAMSKRTLSQTNVEKHLEAVGLDKELGTHNRIRSLSGGQKVKVVLAACTWSQPHLIILDEPTNYLDRESLGALANAIKEFEGGVLLITHNKEFADATTRETWVVANHRCDIKGDAEWEKYAQEQLEIRAEEDQLDAAGNKIEKKRTPASIKPREKKKMVKELKMKIKKDLDMSDFEELCAMEWGLFSG